MLNTSAVYRSSNFIFYHPINIILPLINSITIIAIDIISNNNGFKNMFNKTCYRVEDNALD